MGCSRKKDLCDSFAPGCYGAKGREEATFQRVFDGADCGVKHTVRRELMSLDDVLWRQGRIKIPTHVKAAEDAAKARRERP